MHATLPRLLVVIGLGLSFVGGCRHKQATEPSEAAESAAEATTADPPESKTEEELREELTGIRARLRALGDDLSKIAGTAERGLREELEKLKTREKEIVKQLDEGRGAAVESATQAVRRLDAAVLQFQKTIRGETGADDAAPPAEDETAPAE